MPAFGAPRYLIQAGQLHAYRGGAIKPWKREGRLNLVTVLKIYEAAEHNSHI